MTCGSGWEAVGGGPRWATTTIVYYIWVNALNYYDMVYAAVVVWLLTAVILLYGRLSIKPSTQMLIEYCTQLDINSVLNDPALIQRCVA